MSDARSERAIVLVVAAAQFINVLEFVIVMPLGPDFGRALGIPSHQLAYVASSYTGAAAVAGVLGALFLDRFDRGRALMVTLAGLVTCTFSAGLVSSFTQLICVRALAGLFGGPATSLSMSIVADAVPAERRGRAFGVVLLAFSLASVFGVPAGLELARYAGWRAPFVSIGLLGVLAVLATLRLPPLTAHLAAARSEHVWSTLRRLLSTPKVLLSYSMTFTLQMSGFLVIPNMSPFLQRNLGLPREHLGPLYFAGGLLSVLSTRASGRLVDAYGSLRIGTVGLVLMSATVLAFTRQPPLAWVPILFMAYMISAAPRNVAYNTLASKVPSAGERARFQSLQSAVTHAGITLGAAAAGRVLSTGPQGELIGMAQVAWVSIAISALVPLLMWQVERRVRSPSIRIDARAQ